MRRMMLVVTGAALLCVAGALAAPPIPGGETCADARVIYGLPFAADGTTVGYDNDINEFCPQGAASPDAVYVFVPANDVVVDISVCAGITNYDSVIIVYEDACVSGAYFACNDEFCMGEYDHASALEGLSLVGGHTYYIVMDGYAVSEGDYTLIVDRHLPYDVGDLNCDGAVDFDDIDPFVLALIDHVLFGMEYPDCSWLKGDCDNDGDVDFDDIDSFVALLAGLR